MESELVQTQTPEPLLTNGNNIEIENENDAIMEGAEEEEIKSEPTNGEIPSESIISNSVNEVNNNNHESSANNNNISNSLTTPTPPPDHLGILFLGTAGQNGSSNLGCDEEEIVLLVLSILNIKLNKVLITKSYLIRPVNNETVLSEEIKLLCNITDDSMIIQNGISLENAIEQIDSLIQSIVPDISKFALLVDGQLPIRQSLHPECSGKEINLPNYYYYFFDLRKEFCKIYSDIVPDDISHMFTHLNLEIPKIEATDDVEVECESTPKDEILGKVEEMKLIVQQLLNKGHTFKKPEIVSMKLEPGLCSRSDDVDPQSVVRARGLPWQSSDADIAKFFRGLNIAKGGVALCLSPQGRRNGEALIRFINQEHRDLALKRHKHHIGQRYIEVYKATGDDFLAVAGGSSNEAQAFLTKGGQVIIRMRGLPYDCTPKQVIEFFSKDPNPVDVLDGEEGVLFVRRPDGRATGDAFVLFPNEDDSGKALSKHRESIGSRYIELFRSTTAEVQQVLNRCLEAAGVGKGGSGSGSSSEHSPNGTNINVQTGLPLPPPNHAQAPGLLTASPGSGPNGPNGSMVSSMMSPPSVQLPILPHQQLITIGTRKDCIRLRGLPYEAQVEHILEFLSEHSRNIVCQGVHMVYNSQGQPSGEAFIQMDSELSAFNAAQAKHHRYMSFFKKQRYIEVFQCSGEDMNLVLYGGAAGGGGIGNHNQGSPGNGTGHSQAPGLLSSPQAKSAAAVAAAAAAAAAASGLISPGGTLLGPPPPHAVPGYAHAHAHHHYAAYTAAAHHHHHQQGHLYPAAARNGAAAGIHGFPYSYGQIFYWPYASPPMSPTYYGGAHHGLNQTLIPAECLGALTISQPKHINNYPGYGGGHAQVERMYPGTEAILRSEYIERIGSTNGEKHRNGGPGPGAPVDGNNTATAPPTNGHTHNGNGPIKNYGLELGLFMA